jgi:hypothetical protein
VFRVEAVNVGQTGNNLAETVEMYGDILELTVVIACKVEVI